MKSTRALSIVMLVGLEYYRRHADAVTPAAAEPHSATLCALIRRGWVDSHQTGSVAPHDTLTDAGRAAWAGLTSHGLICDYCDQPATIRPVDSDDILCGRDAYDQYAGGPGVLRALTAADSRKRQSQS
ncbi:hypothetical protein [Kutzneria sp. 744]|uniref:hypothetical protein n=1 Tax=Kutzneria sp. (strain 744) TaxID=345341 RepID=UPI0003EEC966|nr:hypothetical protein [Kutzneria sp. 744]EWM19716.1 hypothetical protein KUTG_10020 [Kutzneria sp. 744]